MEAMHSTVPSRLRPFPRIITIMSRVYEHLAALSRHTWGRNSNDGSGDLRHPRASVALSGDGMHTTLPLRSLIRTAIGAPSPLSWELHV